jgi:signal transduction histidine kinase
MIQANKEEIKKTRYLLARDLHDDLASTISSALIYSNLIDVSKLPENTDILFQKIRSLLVEAADEVTDIIWTVSPKNDNIDDLVHRLKLIMQDLCKVNSIEFSSDFELSYKELKMPENIRRNIYLIYKEAINNIIKHSSATKVNFNVYIDHDLLKFSLFDNGIGFDTHHEISEIKKFTGNGLRNIKARAGEIDAELEIKSAHHQGTYINVMQKVAAPK